MSHLFPSAKGDQLCPLGFHPQVRWPTRCKRCFRDYKEHGNKRNGEDITASTPVLVGSSQSRYVFLKVLERGRFLIKVRCRITPSEVVMVVVAQAWTNPCGVGHPPIICLCPTVATREAAAVIDHQDFRSDPHPGPRRPI